MLQRSKKVLKGPPNGENSKMRGWAKSTYASGEGRGCMQFLGSENNCWEILRSWDAWQRDVLRGRPYRNTRSPLFAKKKVHTQGGCRSKPDAIKSDAENLPRVSCCQKGKEKHRDGGRGPLLPPRKSPLPSHFSAAIPTSSADGKTCLDPPVPSSSFGSASPWSCCPGRQSVTAAGAAAAAAAAAGRGRRGSSTRGGTPPPRQRRRRRRRPKTEEKETRGVRIQKKYNRSFLAFWIDPTDSKTRTDFVLKT